MHTHAIDTAFSYTLSVIINLPSSIGKDTPRQTYIDRGGVVLMPLTHHIPIDRGVVLYGDRA